MEGKLLDKDRDNRDDNADDESGVSFNVFSRMIIGYNSGLSFSFVSPLALFSIPVANLLLCG